VPRTHIAAAAALGVVALGGGAVAVAASAPAAKGQVFTACVGPGHKVEFLYAGAHRCARGQTAYTWNQEGPRGPAGPPGPQGPAGASGEVSVTATTTVTNWPENSGWALDNFTRMVTVIRQHAAASSHCGGTPTCWFYTESLSDNGSFTTEPGATAPNGSNPVKIDGIVAGTIVGGGSLEFYASSGSPSAARVPTTTSGDSKPSTTTNWYQDDLQVGLHRPSDMRGVDRRDPAG
jgi:hypothetical protein